MGNIEEGKSPEQKAVLYVDALADDRQAEAERIFLSVALGKEFDRFCKALEEYEVLSRTDPLQH